MLTRPSPVLMTAPTAVLALVPTAIGRTELDGLYYYPLARTVIGGLTASTFLTKSFKIFSIIWKPESETPALRLSLSICSRQHFLCLPPARITKRLSSYPHPFYGELPPTALTGSLHVC